MKDRITLYEPNHSQDRFGSEGVVEYSLYGRVHAERVRYSGSMSHETGEAFADYRAEWNVRDAHPVLEGWIAEDVAHRRFTVVAIVPNRDRGYITLICEKINE